MSRVANEELAARDRAAEANLFYQGLDMISNSYLILPEVVRDKVLNSAVWQVIGTVAYGLRDYAGLPENVMTPMVNTALG